MLGLLYSAWYGEIRQTLDAALKPYIDDSGPDISNAKAAYYTRALPLFVGAAAVSFILLPDFIGIVLSSARVYWNCGFADAIRFYDAVETLLCAIWGMTLVLACHALPLVCKLKNRLLDLNTLPAAPR